MNNRMSDGHNGGSRGGKRGQHEEGPHQGQPVLLAGQPLVDARAAVILVHGRGASASDILTLANEIDLPGLAYLAPQAAGHTWYPNRFLVPAEQNEPWLSSALLLLDDVVDNIQRSGIPLEKTALLGFSQGACLALEFVARSGLRVGGVAALSGGLIGTDEEVRAGKKRLDSVPVFMGCSFEDPHIPETRVELSAQVLKGLGAQVDARLYPGLGHSINAEELEVVREMLRRLTG